MMNSMMSTKLPIPGILDIEMVMNVVKSAVADEPGDQTCHKTQPEAEL